MQAQYAVGVLAGKYALPTDVREKQEEAWKRLCSEYRTIDTDNVFPVEQYPYCDILAREMGTLPTLKKIGSLHTWLKIMLAPASTIHYLDENFDRQIIEREKIYMPALLYTFLAFMRILGYPFRLGKKFSKRM